MPHCWIALRSRLGRRVRGWLSGWVFGPTPKAHRIWWHRCLEEAQVCDFRWYNLRHTFASRLVMGGVDILRVNKLLRHKTLQVAMRYAHLSDKALDDAIERLAAGVTKSDTPVAPASTLVH